MIGESELDISKQSITLNLEEFQRKRLIKMMMMIETIRELQKSKKRVNQAERFQRTILVRPVKVN